MAIVDDIAHAVPAGSVARRRMDGLRAGLAGFIEAISAGAAASAEYRQLTELSACRESRRGLSRGDIARQVYERHFARLGSGHDGSD